MLKFNVNMKEQNVRFSLKRNKVGSVCEFTQLIYKFMRFYSIALFLSLRWGQNYI